MTILSRKATDFVRRAAVKDWRGRLARLLKLRRAYEAMAEMIDLAVEEAADSECHAALILHDGGPIDCDGKRYSHCLRDGLDSIDVAPIDGHEEDLP